MTHTPSISPDGTSLRDLARLAADLGPALVPYRLRELLDAIVVAAARLFQAEATSLALIDEQSQELVFRAASGGAEEQIVGVRMPMTQGIAGWVASSGQPIAVDDPSHDLRFARELAAALGYMPTSIVAMPLQTERQVIGVLELLDTRVGPPSFESMMAFAHQVAVAIDTLRVFADLGRTLFEAAASAAGGSTLVMALDDLAHDAPGPHGELVELAALFAQLGGVGSRERATATRIVRDFLSYVTPPSVSG